VSYLHPDAAQVAAWRTRLAAMGKPGRRIGLVWSGHPRKQVPSWQALAHRRSIDPDRLAPLFEVPGLHVFSLQKDGPAAPADFRLTDVMGEMADFADTAALVANLDLVISVDTSVAHLAAALGKPVWLLDRFDPDWRWLLGRRDSPWYPTLRLFRQPEPGNWQAVIETVQAELSALVSDRSAVRSFVGDVPTPGSPDTAPASLTPDLQERFADAVRQHQAGHLAEAEDLYRQVLAANPHHADSLHLLGVIGGQTGRHDLAVDMISRAIAINPREAAYHSNLGISLKHQERLAEAAACFRAARDLTPDDPKAHNNLGIALKDQGRMDEAVACYRRALDLKPDDAEVLHNLGDALRAQARPDEVAIRQRVADLQPDNPEAQLNLGVALRAQGRTDDAIICFRRAIEIRPDYPGALNHLGNALRTQGRSDEAIACLRRAVDLKPDYVEAYNNLGIALQAHALQGHGSRDEAVACYRRALELRPDAPEILNNLGTALQEQARLEEAVACYRRAIDLNPGFGEAHNSLGAALQEQGRPDEAVACYRRAIALKPDYPGAYNNLSTALQEQGLLDEAVDSCRRAIDLDPDFGEAHNSLGTTLLEQGHLDEAIACYRRAIDLNPDYADAHCNLAMALLARGNLAAGWEENEWRWKTPQMAKAYRGFAQPQWRGEAAAGQTLLVHAEQGFGDSLQFCRYAPLAAARGLRVIVEAPRPLVRLLRSLPGVAQVVTHGEALPAFDLHCPMLSLPLALGITTLAAIPSTVPYLHADSAQVAAWRARLAAMANQGPRIGLVWAGNPREHLPSGSAVDRRRSIGPEPLAPLFDLPGLHFFSLQKDGPAAPPDFPLTDFMREMGDFADTAALIANLDLVISVDTSVAHLAAALGKPVWLLDRFDPCWRWLVGRRDSPWYPTLRLFRQPNPGDWRSVVETVRAELRSFVRDRPATASPDTAPAGPLPDVQGRFAEAVRQHQAGHLADAEDLYRQVLAANPDHADSLHLLGVIGGQTGRHDLAVEMIGRAIAINPREAAYHANLGIALRQQHRLDEAVLCFRAALDLKPDDAEAHNNLGIALKELWRLEEAVACYRRAIDLRPNFPRAHHNLGNALWEQGRLDEAAMCYRRALELQPDYKEAQSNLAHVLREQGTVDEAVAWSAVPST
jgi:tetratricopeptide (TPR) repeat protein